MPHFRIQRRSLALAAGALLLAAPLSACGFQNATDEIYVPSAGVNHREGNIDVLSAVVVSHQEGSGTFIATFSNNSTNIDDKVIDIKAAPDDPAVKVLGFEPIPVTKTAFVNLADNPSIAVQGDFSAGDYVSLTIDFEVADTIEMHIPIVADRYQYEGLDISAEAVASANASASASPTP